jgi:hypothetical protein
MKPGNFQFHFITFSAAIFIFFGTCPTGMSAGITDTLQPEKPHGNYPTFYQGHISVDGNLADWPSKMFYDNPEARILYAVGNDSSMLYICLQVMEQSEENNIIHEGLTFRIEPGGKKKESVLVQFPYGPAKPVDPPPPGPGDHPGQPGVSSPPSSSGDHSDQGHFQHSNQLKGQGKRWRPTPKRFTAGLKITGFRDGIDGIYPSDTAVKHVDAAMSYDTTGALVLEIGIPLSAFKNDLKEAKYVSLLFAVTNQGGTAPQDAPPTEHQNGNYGNGGNTHGGGRHGGMQGGGMPGGGQGEMGGGHGEGHGGGSSRNGAQNQSKDFKISHKFSIAPGQ